MSAYFGNKRLFQNKIGGSPIREIYFGNKGIISYVSSDYVADEFIGEKAPAGDVPIISGNGSSISVKTNNYNPGYAFSRYYADSIKISMMYSGSLIVYDKDGNEVVSIIGKISFNYATGKWTIGSKCTINGTTMFDESVSVSNIEASRLIYYVYYDLTNHQWVCEWNNSVYRASQSEWKHVYFRVAPQIWFIISTESSMYFDGIITITNLNRAKGLPEART